MVEAAQKILTWSDLRGKHACEEVDFPGVYQHTLRQLGNLLVKSRHEGVQSLHPKTTFLMHKAHFLTEKFTFLGFGRHE